MRDVAVLGVGMTKFGKFMDRSLKDLAREACWAAIQDAGIDPKIPKNYYPDDDPTQKPLCQWRSGANLLFGNWLDYFVYQETPYVVEEVGNME